MEVFALILVQDLRESLVPRGVLRLQIYNQNKVNKSHPYGEQRNVWLQDTLISNA